MRFKKPVGAMQPKIQANSACWDTFYTMKHNSKGRFRAWRKSYLVSSLGHVDFLAGQATFEAYFSNGQGSKSSSDKIIN